MSPTVGYRNTMTPGLSSGLRPGDLCFAVVERRENNRGPSSSVSSVLGRRPPSKRRHDVSTGSGDDFTLSPGLPPSGSRLAVAGRLVESQASFSEHAELCIITSDGKPHLGHPPGAQAR